MIEVCVPATSANIGPGFDCMGLALKLYATFQFERIDEGLRIEGCDPLWQNEQNLLYQAFVKTLDYMGEKVPGIAIYFKENDVPEARGLGSSAVCIVAGAMAANALFGSRLNKYEIFDLCTQLEGHPDNVAPAIFGSLCVSFMDEGKPNMIRYAVDPNLHFCAIIPNYPTLTEEAREVLPKSMSYADAIFQMGRVAALAKGLEIGNPMIISKACQDHMHQPYRKHLIKEYDEVEKICKENGAIAFFISGSGSTMMAIHMDENKADHMVQEVRGAQANWQVLKLDVDRQGAQVKEV